MHDAGHEWRRRLHDVVVHRQGQRALRERHGYRDGKWDGGAVIARLPRIRRGTFAFGTWQWHKVVRLFARHLVEVLLCVRPHLRGGPRAHILRYLSPVTFEAAQTLEHAVVLAGRPHLAHLGACVRLARARRQLTGDLHVVWRRYSSGSSARG